MKTGARGFAAARLPRFTRICPAEMATADGDAVDPICDVCVCPLVEEAV